MKAFKTITEIAKETGKSRTSIFREIKAGRMGRVPKVGNQYRIPHPNFQKWHEQYVSVFDAKNNSKPK